jgi:pimeloyl-ACP methyl ester carboxylesterase
MAGVKPPSRLLGLLEPLRASAEFASLVPAGPLLARAPRGDGHTVLVLPGFTASDASTVPLRRFLRRLGWDAIGWSLGRNLGFSRLGDQLDPLLDAALDRAGGPVSIVGWSLGGVMGRRLARTRPDDVTRLVMLGSPITGSPTDTAVWRAYDAIEPGRRAEIEARYRLGDLLDPAPGVPSTSIFSRSDGVVPWRIARETPGPLTENVEVLASHLGLGVNPAVFYAVADRLSQGIEPWERFVPPRMLRGLITSGR